jgi:hypothetical protein
MNLHAAKFSRKATRSSKPILLTTLAVAAMFLTTQTWAQAQEAQPTPTSVSTPALSLELGPAPLSLEATAISAPAPVSQEAKLINPFEDSHFSFASTPDYDYFQNNSNAAPAHPPAKHHGLAKTAAIAGTAVLGFGVVAFALAAGHCKSYASGPCDAFHTGGIAMMAGGGAVAATGFYFWFRKP